MTKDEAAHFGGEVALALLKTDQAEIDEAAAHVTGTLMELLATEPMNGAVAIAKALTWLTGHFLIERGARGPLSEEEAERFRDHLSVLYMERGLDNEGERNAE